MYEARLTNKEGTLVVVSPRFERNSKCKLNIIIIEDFLKNLYIKVWSIDRKIYPGSDREMAKDRAATFVPRDSLTTEKWGSLFHAFLSTRGKLTAAQSRSKAKRCNNSGSTAQHSRIGKRGGEGEGRSYATRTRMSPAASRIYHKKNEWSIRE